MSAQSGEIVTAVLDELEDRGGFDHWWGSIDKPIRDEITQKLILVVGDVLTAREQS